MKTDQPKNSAAVFLQTVEIAVAQLKQRLQQNYEQAYPDLREMIHRILDKEEARAWELTLFPHLVLPDLVEAHIANLNLQPVQTNHRDLFVPDRFSPVPSYRSAVALCG